MFEKEIQFITDFNLNKIKRLGSFFTLDDLTKAKVHPAIVRYISAEIDYLIFLDRQNLLQKSVFDYSGTELAQHFLAISQEIKKNKLLPYEEVKKIIQQAVTFQLTYLLRPVWTLKKFVFDTSEVRSQEEVKMFFNYLYFYDYYKKIFLTILEKKQLLTITIFEFESFLEKIQKQLLEQQMKNVLENALIDIAEFLNSGEVIKTRLSIETLEIFLKDKGLHNHIFRIRKLLSVDPKQKFELSEIQSALFSSLSFEVEEELAEEKQREVEQNEAQLDIFKSAEDLLNDDEKQLDDLLQGTTTPEVEAPKVLKPEILKPEENESGDPVSASDSSINGEVFSHEVDSIDEGNSEDHFLEEEALHQKESRSEEEVDSAAESVIEDEDSADESVIEDEDLAAESVIEDEDLAAESANLEDLSLEESAPPQEEETVAQVENDSFKEDGSESEDQEKLDSVEEEPVKEKFDSTDKPENDIFGYFTTKETMKIINVIFNQDSLDFVNTLESIAECSNEDEADQIIKDVFLSYRVNSVGKEAVLLKEKIEQFFRDKEF
ncbi:MAG: hypothetical protein COW85_10085 [Ignavibacteria bacterium CG22_combo_CG10-13_8_21_14_all_37_15]|nr:MAG: hypothetical protein COW85_10085 [Ignavibacteria bacterium CG22_combo_CG10-13_8_21_14_all_37_15]